MSSLDASPLATRGNAGGNGGMTPSRNEPRIAKRATAARRRSPAPVEVPVALPDNPALELRSRFRSSLRLVASTVAIVTAAHDGKRGGLTATATCSLSVDPPLMLVCVNRRSNTHGFMWHSERFCINYLGTQHRDLADLFAVQVTDTDAKFAAGKWGVGRHGTPVLLDSLSTIECQVVRRFDEGTHTIFIGAVLDVVARDHHAPLLYVQGGFAGVAR
jgi:flavin reductase (DIM6/NTAB) family NADH-FMN oxidoreductase RutF